MRICKENGSDEVQELNFYSKEVFELLKADMKLLTLRKPNAKYDFKIGEVIEVNCSDVGEKLRLVVIGNVTKPLANYDILDLILDGYESLDQAVSDLRTYSGYEKVREGTEMQGVYTVKEETFLEMTEEKKNYLLEMGPETISDVDQPNKEIFWHAWCGWVIARGGGMPEWRFFLLGNGLASVVEIDDNYQDLNQEQLMEVWKDRGSNLYKKLVLLEEQDN